MSSYYVLGRDPSTMGTQEGDMPTHPALQAGPESRQGWETTVRDPPSQGGWEAPREEAALKANRWKNHGAGIGNSRGSWDSSARVEEGEEITRESQSFSCCTASRIQGHRLLSANPHLPPPCREGHALFNSALFNTWPWASLSSPTHRNPSQELTESPGPDISSFLSNDTFDPQKNKVLEWPFWPPRVLLCFTNLPVTKERNISHCLFRGTWFCVGS